MAISQAVLAAYSRFIDPSYNSSNGVYKSEPIPKFSLITLLQLFEETISHLSNSKAVININGPTTVVGDLHGNLIDLFRILRTNTINQHNFLFLGDYVDRGQFSLEVITLLFAALCQYPQTISILRGNHEMMFGIDGGFKTQIMEMYGNLELYNKAFEVFSYLPIVAIVNDSYFCVHGGISNQMIDLDTLNQYSLPIKYEHIIESQNVIQDLLWSDPTTILKYFGNSTRGNGVLFGEAAVNDFLSKHKFLAIIRAHQFTEKGTSNLFKGKCITVFSSSNYIPGVESPVGLLDITKTELIPRRLPPGPQVDRKLVNFYEAKGGSLSLLKSGQQLVSPGMRLTKASTSRRVFAATTYLQISRKKTLSPSVNLSYKMI